MGGGRLQLQEKGELEKGGKSDDELGMAGALVSQMVDSDVVVR